MRTQQKLIDRLDDDITVKIQKYLRESSYFDSVYTKNVELKLKLIEMEKRINQRIIESETVMKQAILVSEKQTYVALEPFLDWNNHVTGYISSCVDMITVTFNIQSRYDASYAWEHGYFDFFFYDSNDSLVDNFDIDYGLYEFLKGNPYRAAIHTIQQVHDIIKSKICLQLKDENKFILMNTKNNSTFYTIGSITFLMPQNTLMKKIIIDTHKTKGQHHNDGRVDKVEHVNVDLFTFIDNKMKNVKKFSVHVKDTNGICTINNYMPLTFTGNSP